MTKDIPNTFEYALHSAFSATNLLLLTVETVKDIETVLDIRRLLKEMEIEHEKAS